MSDARYHLIVFQSGSPRDPLGFFDGPLLDRIQRLTESISTSPQATLIDVWLESRGGDANVAYRMALELRERCKTLRVIIPNAAKSAATLFALAAEAIYMAPAAELGPLDAQIQHPERENVLVSALDVANALTWIGQYAVTSTVRGGAEILRSTNLTRQDVLREFLAFTAQFLQPLVKKLDPHLLHRAANELKIASEYAVKLLRTRRAMAPMGFDPAVVAQNLVEGYPAHDFVISRDEAGGLGLPVGPLESYDRRELLLKHYWRFRENVRASWPDCSSRVTLLRDDDLDRHELQHQDDEPPSEPNHEGHQAPANQDDQANPT